MFLVKYLLMKYLIIKLKFKKIIIIQLLLQNPKFLVGYDAEVV